MDRITLLSVYRFGVEKPRVAISISEPEILRAHGTFDLVDDSTSKDHSPGIVGKCSIKSYSQTTL